MSDRERVKESGKERKGKRKRERREEEREIELEERKREIAKKNLRLICWYFIQIIFIYRGRHAVVFFR